VGSTGVSNTGQMRMTELWRRMNAHFGERHAQVFAVDHVLSRLQNRTVRESLAAGCPAREVWDAVCAEMDIPATHR
jgi:hypothetical protein